MSNFDSVDPDLRALLDSFLGSKWHTQKIINSLVGKLIFIQSVSIHDEFILISII